MNQLIIPSLRQEVKQSHINKTYENNQRKTLKQLIEEKQILSVPYNNLCENEINGTFCGSYRDDNGTLYASYIKTKSHLMCVGGTGSGKTTGFVEPSLRFLSSKKNKASFMVMDPKGELFTKNVKHLKKYGYKINVLNFNDTKYTDSWNPLLEIYDSWMRQKTINENTDVSIESQIATILSETEDLIQQLVHTLIPDSICSPTDPSWGLGAQEILKGMLYLLLEDALDENSGFTRDNMNLMTIRDYFEEIRNEVIDVANNRVLPLCSIKKLAHKSSSDESIKHMKPFFENAASTARCYLGIYSNAMQKWFNTKIFTACNGDTIQLNEESDQPFAIFLTTRDYEKSDYTVAGMFIEYVYRQMLQKAEKNGGSLDREMYYLLDELGNCPQIASFCNKISTARSRNIWFYLFIQSYAQLDAVYGAHCSQIIKDNCNAHVFLGSENYQSKYIFSCECGRCSIPTLGSALIPDDYQVLEAPLLPISDLESLEPGQMFIRFNKLPLLETHFERSYLCPEFTKDGTTTPEKMGIISVPFNSEIFKYKYIYSSLSMNEYKKEIEKQNNIDEYEGEKDHSERKAIDVFPNFMKYKDIWG